LFSWNSPSDRNASSKGHNQNQVSILVFLELALGRYNGVRRIRHVAEFQSLFSWNSPSDAEKWWPRAPFPRSFNPCFLGTRPRTSLSAVRIIFSSTNQSFNPCFLGTRPRTAGGGSVQWHSICVSILVFLELALGRNVWATSQSHIRSFNPCFLGTRPRTSTFQSSQRMTRVSILVFLELALGLLPTLLSSFSFCCFNPCFLGTRPRTVGPQIPFP